MRKERDANRFAQATARKVLVRSDAMFALFHAVRGDWAAAEPYVARLEQGVRDHQVSPVPLAEVYSVTGRTPEAMQYLRLAFQTRDRQMLYVKVNPFLRPLREEAEFRSIVQYMRL